MFLINYHKKFGNAALERLEWAKKEARFTKMPAKYKVAMGQYYETTQHDIFNRDPKELQQDLMEDYEQVVCSIW